MSRTPVQRGEPLQLTEEEQAAVASLKLAVRQRGNGRGREGRELSLATLTVVGGLSLGVVAGLAYLSEEGERFSWLAAALTNSASKPSFPAPPSVPSKAAEAEPFLTETALVKAASAFRTESKPTGESVVAPAVGGAEVKPQIQEAPAMDASPAGGSLQSGPIHTASISPALRLPPMTLPPQDVPQAELIIKAPEAPPADSSVSSPPSPPRPRVSSAEAQGYLAKAEAALRSGDLIVARSFFERLAQAGDPRGALGMARTYDDAELGKLPIFGPKPDRAKAERWRLRAHEMTSTVARN